MESGQDFYELRALLEWQVELGATEAILDAPIDRFEIVEDQPKPAALNIVADAPQPPAKAPLVDPVTASKSAADNAGDLDALRNALAAYEHCDLKRGARNLVFSDGNPRARVMIIGEAPGRDEDREGRPFVGRAGQLLDKMLAAIDLDRNSPDTENAVYITNVLPWRPPQNRDPSTEEIEMLRPFLERHVALADPDVVVIMGNISCQAVLGKRGITRLRGNWATAFDKPVLPMFHPAFLLRQPHNKRAAWADLLELNARLKEL